MIPELETCNCRTRKIVEMLERVGYETDQIRSLMHLHVHAPHCPLWVVPSASIETKFMTIIRLPQYGAALVVATVGSQAQIFYGPQLADGTVHFNDDDFIPIRPEDIHIAQEVGTRRRN